MPAVAVPLVLAGLGTLVWFAVLAPEPPQQRAGAMAPSVDDGNAPAPAAGTLMRVGGVVLAAGRPFSGAHLHTGRP